MKRRGFSMIELLVVIAIIAMLIAIVLPALGKARELSKRATCASGLHELGIGMLTYAGENTDRLYLGYNSTIGVQDSYEIWRSSGYYTAGLPYYFKQINNLKAFFCPSETLSNNAYPDGVTNWLPGTAGQTCRSSYSFRAYGLSLEDMAWPAPVAGANPPFTFPAVACPRYSSFGQSAVAADEISNSSNPGTRHVTGINLMDGDASTHWVKLQGTFKTDLNSLPVTFSASAAPTVQAMWIALDNL